MSDQCVRLYDGNRGKTPGRFDAGPNRFVVGRQKMAESRAYRSDFERMLHLRARTFAPLTLIRKRGKSVGTAADQAGRLLALT
jgi:hypothetical protein